MLALRTIAPWATPTSVANLVMVERPLLPSATVVMVEEWLCVVCECIVIGQGFLCDFEGGGQLFAWSSRSMPGLILAKTSAGNS
jgi:hypothetical protein